MKEAAFRISPNEGTLQPEGFQNLRVRNGFQPPFETETWKQVHFLPLPEMEKEITSQLQFQVQHSKIRSFCTLTAMRMVPELKLEPSMIVFEPVALSESKNRVLQTQDFEIINENDFSMTITAPYFDTSLEENAILIQNCER